MPTVFPKVRQLDEAGGEQVLLSYSLFSSAKRLTLDIHKQYPMLVYTGDDDGDYYYFKASNGYEIISRSRMDLQTERIWLDGASLEVRSGSMVFSHNGKRDQAAKDIKEALLEWAQSVAGKAHLGFRATKSSGLYTVEIVLPPKRKKRNDE